MPHHKRYQGKVTRCRQPNALVEVERLVRHPVYGKVVRGATTFQADWGVHTCRVGDTVELLETRPLSKQKRWVITRVLRRASDVEVSRDIVADDVGSGR